MILEGETVYYIGIVRKEIGWEMRDETYWFGWGNGT